MNAKTPDYGEPWQPMDDDEIWSDNEDEGTLAVANGCIRDRILACINACAGMADPAAEIANLKMELDAALAANAAMREAIREAHAALDGCREDTCELFADHDWWKDEHRCDYSTRWEDMKSRISKADAALAKLQPFTTP